MKIFKIKNFNNQGSCIAMHRDQNYAKKLIAMVLGEFHWVGKNLASFKLFINFDFRPIMRKF